MRASTTGMVENQAEKNRENKAELGFMLVARRRAKERTSPTVVVTKDLS